MTFDFRTFVSPGPVATSYLLDRENAVRFIMGPQGSGKTNLDFFDKLTLAQQMPKCVRGGRNVEGNRFYRHVELRDTYSNLWNSTIKSWNMRWFNQQVGNWSGGEGRKATHNLTFNMNDGGLLFFEVVFQAIQDGDVEAALRGTEMNSVNLGEADQMSPDVLPYALGRTEMRRYPPKEWLAPDARVFNSVTGDLNAPDTDSWIYNVFEEIRPEGHKLYKQPSGRSAEAENPAGVTRRDYEALAKMNAHRPWWVKRMVDGKFAASRSGTPVYATYDDDLHCAPDILEPVKGAPIRLSFDQGVTGPAMLVSQWLPWGQLRVLDEICPGRIGPSGFGHMCKLLLEGKYRGYRVERSVGDRAGFSGGDKETGDLHFFDVISNIIGHPILPCDTQEIDIRHDAVRQLLRSVMDNNSRGLLISRACTMLRKGFNSHYRYRKKKGVENATDPKPEKNEYSNPHDALQYQAIDLVGVEGVKRGLLMRGVGDRMSDGEDEVFSGNVMAKTDFNVWAS